jgi:hypothetical protein
MADRPLFILQVKGASKVKRMLDRAILGTSFVFNQKNLERLLVERTRGRFNEAGGGGRYQSVAQRDPSGKRWKDLSPETLETHPNSNRILYRTGALQKSIGVVRRRMSKAQLQSPTGGGFSIGVRGGNEIQTYARVQNFGSDERNIPARRFLGIGPGDVDAVDNFIARNFAKSGLRVS